MSQEFDGPFATQSSPSFEPINGGCTRTTIRTGLPDSLKGFDPSLMSRSLRDMKALIESEA